jgi:DNA-directed RNA polymerase subunit alpha
MEEFTLPENIEFNEGDEEHAGEVVISPFERGYGHTIANAYRRVLLSSLPGAAVESLQIEGVQHEFTTVDGVKEDVIEIILNLKELAVKVHSEDSISLELKADEKGNVTAQAFEENADVEIVNDDLKLFTVVDEDVEVNMEVTFGPGRGYIKSDEKNTEDWPVGTIAIDSRYSPIYNVGYDVEKMRIEETSDYDKAIIEVETDGTISAEEAVDKATEILLDHFEAIKEQTE